MQIIEIPIKDLKPAEYNPRAATEKEMNDLKESLKRFGFVDPNIVNSAPKRKNVIIGGHMRTRAWEEMGHKTAPCVLVNIPELKKEQELNLRLNKNTGHWDFEMLANFEESQLLEVGFGSEELDKFYALETEEDGFQTEENYGKIKAQTKLGQIIQLGEHRLMCGDATKSEDLKLLMGEDKAQMVFTDPPYNVNYDYESKYKFLKRKRKEPLRGSQGAGIFNDKQTPEQFYQFLLKAFKNAYDFTADDMAIYICFSTSTGRQFMDAMKDAGYHYSQTIIWLKDRIILSLGQDYHRCYEPILFGWKDGQARYSNKMINTEKELWSLDKKKFEEMLDVWYIKKDNPKDYRHPTQKPIRLAERAIKKNSRRDDIVLDLFGGSGSTLMACEQLKRRGYLMELDPVYCDKIIQRYEAFAHQKAQKQAKKA